MRVLILGGDGMLGHQLFLSWYKKYQVWVSLRQEIEAYGNMIVFTEENAFFNVDVTRFSDVAALLNKLKPQVVINAVGLIKQRNVPDGIDKHLQINALFPQKLACLCEQLDIRLIQVSTDCVFSGKKGNYSEEDICDVEDIYGISKYLGEVYRGNGLTLRTSIIGLELSRKASLIEWFLAQSGLISGYKKAIYTGLTTFEIARVLENIMINHGELKGLWHLSSDPITKYELLSILAKKLNRQDVQILPDETLVCDRSLNSGRLRAKLGYEPPDWDFMLSELAAAIIKRKEFCKSSR